MEQVGGPGRGDGGDGGGAGTKPGGDGGVQGQDVGGRGGAGTSQAMEELVQPGDGCAQTPADSSNI